MKCLSLFFLVLFIIVWFPGRAIGWREDGTWSNQSGRYGKNWESWQEESENTPVNKKKSNRRKSDTQWNRDKWQGKFCKDSSEKELLDLLEQLAGSADKGQQKPGQRSEILRRAKIIIKLRKFDDCRAEDALRKLSKEDHCEDMSAGDLLCLQWVAKTGLEEMESRADLKKLKPETSFAEQEKIIKKYTTRPYKNDFALQQIKQYLVEQASVNPSNFLQLASQYFPDDPRIERLLRQYPQMADHCLKSCLASPDATTVWWCINLARSLRNPKFLKQAAEVVFEGKGNVDYARKSALEELQIMAIGYFRDFESRSVPFYQVVLFSDYDKGKEYVISGIHDLQNHEILSLLKKFSATLQRKSLHSTSLLAKRLRKKIEIMERAQQ